MAHSAYLNSLKSQHAALDRAIAQEEQRPAPDDLALKAMKRRKLRLKDMLQATAPRTVEAAGAAAH